MVLRTFVNAPLMLVGVVVAACSSDGSGGATPSSSMDTNAAPTDMGQPAPSAQMPVAPAPGDGARTPMSEAQPTDIGLNPSSMTPDPSGGTIGESAPPAAGAPVPSAGCGSTQAVESGRFTIDVEGTPRDYILELPDDYDSTRPYRLIFGWHPRGGSAEQVANGFGGGFYGLEQLAEGSAIFVSAEGIDEGWANTGGRDIALLDGMLERFDSELCFDRSRVFSTGFSYGGMMSLAIGCARGDVFRAIAPMSGALYSGCVDGDAPVAFLGFHGVDDTVVPLGNGQTARNVFVERNGCQPEAAVESDGCVRFQGCAAASPVTWCEFDGGHTPAPGSAQAIWEFFTQF
jgi:polyhydroxybutyrate depolymerase